MDDTLNLDGDDFLFFPELDMDLGVAGATDVSAANVDVGNTPNKKAKTSHTNATKKVGKQNNSAKNKPAANTNAAAGTAPTPATKTAQQLEEESPAAARQFYELLNEIVNSVAIEAQRMQW